MAAGAAASASTDVGGSKAPLAPGARAAALPRVSKEAPDCCTATFGPVGNFFSALFAALDLLNTILVISVGVVVIVLMVTSAHRAVLVPLVLIPSVLFFMSYTFLRPTTWAKTRKADLRELDNLAVRSFFLAATVGFAISLAIETLLTASFVATLFSAEAVAEARKAFASRFSGKETAAPVGVHLAANFSTFLFLFLTSFVASANVEETVKACVVRFNCCGRVRGPMGGRSRARLTNAACGQPDHLRTPRATAILLVASAVGMATMENLIYTLEDDTSLEKGSATALARSLVSLPMQVVGAVFTAASFAHADFAIEPEDRWSWPACLARAVVFHGVFDLAVIGMPVALKLAGMSEMVLTIVNFVVSVTIVLIGAFLAYSTFDASLKFVLESNAKARTEEEQREKERTGLASKVDADDDDEVEEEGVRP